MDANTDFFKTSGTSLNLEGDQSQLAVMFNGFWYPYPNWKMSPYLGAGLGFTKISWNNIRSTDVSGILDDSDNVFTYQLIIGGSYKISSQLSLDVDYRYFAPGDIEIADDSGILGKFDNQELNIFALAIKYKF